MQREALCTPFLLPPPAAKEKKGSLWGHPKPRQRAKPPGPPLSAHTYGHPLWVPWPLPAYYPTICILPSCWMPRIIGETCLLVTSTSSHRCSVMGQLTPSNCSLLILFTSVAVDGSAFASVVEPSPRAISSTASQISNAP